MKEAAATIWGGNFFPGSVIGKEDFTVGERVVAAVSKEEFAFNCISVPI
jgi:hypothetical protein